MGVAWSASSSHGKGGFVWLETGSGDVGWVWILNLSLRFPRIRHVAPPDVPPGARVMVMIVRILDETGRIDPQSLRPQLRSLPSGQRRGHGRTDPSVGRHDPMPRERRRLHRRKSGQHKRDVPGLHIHVRGNGPVGGELPFGDERHQANHLCPNSGKRLGLGLGHATNDIQFYSQNQSPSTPVHSGGNVPEAFLDPEAVPGT